MRIHNVMFTLLRFAQFALAEALVNDLQGVRAVAAKAPANHRGRDRAERDRADKDKRDRGRTDRDRDRGRNHRDQDAKIHRIDHLPPRGLGGDWQGAERDAEVRDSSALTMGALSRVPPACCALHLV